ncbi:MAG TPA: NAD(P)/FAD-dependent oxidoreductase [Gemmatimonas sp.]|uniref:FAD-dependent oxidoreductase n=1 Tax=Gemmatimonas sp. TaxID=1962908 RepID=UPI002ED88890
MLLQSLRIIVIGGATGGCAAALLFARAGAHVTLIEREAHQRAVGAGIALAANGMAVLESVGLGPALRVARPVDGIRVVRPSGQVLLTPPADTSARMIRRSTLQNLLLDSVAAEPRIETRFGTSFLSATSHGVATVRHDATGSVEHLTADLVIGADGVHSRVRESGDFGATVEHTGVHYWRTLLPPGLGQQVEAWTSAGIFGSFEVDDGTYVYASCSTPLLRNAIRACDLDTLKRAWLDAYPAAASLLNAVHRWESLLVHEVLRVLCRRWWHDKLVLLGDAAHAMAPNLGQGANSALVDAAVLLDELRRANTLTDGLEAYARRRKPRVHAVARTAAALGQLGEWTGPVARGIRDRVLVPVMNAMTTSGAYRRVLQEDPDVLRAIGRA